MYGNTERTCDHCGGKLPGPRPRWGTRFCGSNCRVAHHRLTGKIKQARKELADLLAERAHCASGDCPCHAA